MMLNLDLGSCPSMEINQLWLQLIAQTTKVILLLIVVTPVDDPIIFQVYLIFQAN